MNAVPTMAEPHVPVLLDEVCASLAPLQGALVIDGTFGAGGYARAFLAAGAHVIGIDRDPNALSAADDLTGLTLVAGVFGDIEEHAAVHAPEGADAVVLDIGVSSMQLDQAERGFSFLRDGPLDMRMGSDGPSAADLIADLTEEALADILYRYGEERASRRIAKAIVSARAQRPIARTLALAEIVAGCLPAQRPGQIHPATRTFQALRIAVNDELGELVRALAGAEKVLRVGGRLAIVSFHSLEDRIVKRYLQMASATSAGGSRHGPDQRLPAPRFARPPKPITASKAEVSRNPRARSARLRWAVRTDAPSRAFEPKAIGLPVLATINRGRRS